MLLGIFLSNRFPEVEWYFIGVPSSEGMHIYNFDRYCENCYSKGCTDLLPMWVCTSDHFSTPLPTLDIFFFPILMVDEKIKYLLNCMDK